MNAGFTLIFRSLGLVLLVVAALAAATAASAAPTSSLDVRADVVDYYSNRFVVTGDGNVRVRLSDGSTVTSMVRHGQTNLQPNEESIDDVHVTVNDFSAENGADAGAGAQ